MSFTKEQLAFAGEAALAVTIAALDDKHLPHAWHVEVLQPHGHYLFRTRSKARAFAKAQEGPAYVSKAYWGRR